MADIDGDGDWELSDLTGSPDLERHASVCIDYDRLQEVCSDAGLPLPFSVLNLFVLLYGLFPR